MVLLIAAAALWPASSAEAGPRIIEFQMPSSSLLTLVRQRVLEEDFCLSQSFSLPYQSGEYVLDHIFLPGGEHLQKVSGQIQIVVPVQLYTKTLECLTDPNCGATDYSPPSPLAFDVVFDLSAEAVDTNNNGKLNQTRLCLSFSHLVFLGQEVPLEILDPAMVDGLGSLVQSVCKPMNMGVIQKFLAGKPDIKAAGLSANANLTRIGVRTEFVNPSNPDAPPSNTWGAFFAGQLAPTAPGKDWSLFVDKDLFKAAITKRFTDSLEGNDEIEILAGPNTTWQALGAAGGIVQISMELDVEVDECPNTIGVDPAVVTMSFVVDPNNVVKTLGNLSTDLVDSDVILCALSYGPLGLIGLPIFAAVAAGEGPGEGDFPNECNQLNDDDFECSMPVDIPDITISKWGAYAWATKAILTLDTFHGHTDGPVLAGPIQVQIAPAPAFKLLEVGQGQFSYGVQGGCSSLKLGWSGGVPVGGSGKLCSMEVVDDPLHVFKADLIDLGQTSSGSLNNKYIEITFTNWSGYFDNPYPCKIVLRTTVGVRCIEIPSPAQPSDEEQFAMIGELALAKANCLKELNFIPGKMNPQWLIDPPPWEAVVDVLLDDYLIPTEDISAQVSDLQIGPVQTMQGLPADGGFMQLPAVQMTVMANVQVNTAMVPTTYSAPAPFTGGLAGGGFIAGKGGPAAKSAMGAKSIPETFEVAVEVPVVVPLSGQLPDGDGLTELSLDEPIQQIVHVPADQLPEGVKKMAFMLEVYPEEMTVDAELIPAETEVDESVAPLDAECGSGVCGVGSAGMLPLMILGWCTARRRSRQWLCIAP